MYEVEENAIDSVAVVGLAGKFPGAKDTEQFWENLSKGVESVTFFSDEELLDAGVDVTVLEDPHYVKAKAILDDVDLFDPVFFNISHREAEVMDPQQRLFLQCAWEALESAGYSAENYTSPVGLFAGGSLSSYLLFQLLPNYGYTQTAEMYQAAIGNDKDFLSTRVSYKLNLQGPSLSVQTACSSSLVAIHLACQSILNGECDMALAGGVSVSVPQRSGYHYQEEGIASPDGHTRAFDRDAKGCVRGEGVGVVVLKGLEDAVRDGDCIWAVVKGSAINNDGASKVGYWAPSIQGQASVIADALSIAGVQADTVTYVEAHGTATPLGDPIEISALTQAFRKFTNKKRYCALGSVKTNIGHLDAAAGVAGFIKTVLALKHGRIPPTLHFKEPNPKIDFEDSPFYPNTTLADWRPQDQPRRAGVSSFGIGGTNAHVILEEAPHYPNPDAPRPWQLVPLSARTENALEDMTSNLKTYLDQHPEIDFADIAYTLQVGRVGFSQGRVMLCESKAGLAEVLMDRDSKYRISGRREKRKRDIVMMFPGQGTQYVNMGLDLYKTERVFREHVDQCFEHLRAYMDCDLRQVIYPDKKITEYKTWNLDRTSITQPALFCIEYALAKLWMEWGIMPDAMIGHSIGEYVAACLAGVFTLEDALQIVAVRGKLMETMPEGRMLAVPLMEEEVLPFLNNDISIAAVNDPASCVVSGDSMAIDRLAKSLSQEGLTSKMLNTSQAFHSHMMNPILNTFVEQVRRIDLQGPQIPYLSNVTGTWIQEADATNPDYWADHLRQTVRFNSGLQALLQNQDLIFLEVGPGRTLSSFVSKSLNKKPGHVALTSLRHPQVSESDCSFLLRTLGKLWLEGAVPDWKRFQGTERRRVALPTYPFEHKRYWLDGPTGFGKTKATQNELQIEPPIEDWFYVPSWKRTLFQPRVKVSTTRLCWLVFTNKLSLGRCLIEQLVQLNQDVIIIGAGEGFQKVSDSEYVIDPKSPEDYKKLLVDLEAMDKKPVKVIHLWGVADQESLDFTIKEVKRAQCLGFNSLIYLVQAFGGSDLQVLMVSSNSFGVTGKEELRPEKMMLLGPIKVVPQEYQNIDCCNLDIVLPEEDSEEEQQLVANLLAECVLSFNQDVVAFRGSHRWVQDLEPVHMSDYKEESRLKREGVYLITGGVGGIGLEIAEFLARKVRAKIALVSRSSLPARQEWDDYLSNLPPNHSSITEMNDQKQPPKPEIDLENEISNLEQSEIDIKRKHKNKGLHQYKGLSEAADKLCASYISYYFKTGGIELKKDKDFNKEEIKSQLGILPKFERLFEAFLRFLEEDEIIKIDGEQILCLQGIDTVAEPDRLKTELREKFPEFESMIALLDHCVAHYESALCGKIEPLSVLYPKGETKLLEQVTSKLAGHSNFEVYALTLKKLISDLLKKTKQKLRILEVGGGNGGLTRVLGPELKGKNVEYYFTDLGSTFVYKAQSESVKQGLDFMEFGVLDISRDPFSQGYEKNSFDIILGYNVVHATKDVQESLANLRQLLSPHGLICLIESVQSQRWVDMIWGLTDGWWVFEDVHLRDKSPLLDLDTWQDVLHKQAGIESVVTLPKKSGERMVVDSGLIIAQGDAGGKNEDRPEILDTRKKIQKIKEIEELGSEVLVLSADVSDLKQMGTVKTEICERFGQVNGIIHAAAISGGGTIQFRTPEAIDLELAAKVTGTVVIDRLFRDTELDFFALFSSGNAITGGLGQVVYSAANAFLDAFAHYKAAQGDSTVVSINWNRWQNTGLGLVVEQAHLERTGEVLSGGVSVDEGLEVFQKILSSSYLPQVIVSKKNIRNIDVFQESKKGSKKNNLSPSTTKHERVQVATMYNAPESTVEEQICETLEELLNIQAVGIDDDFFEIGGDSLIGIQAIARLNEVFLVTLSPRVFFEAPTVRELALVVEDRIISQAEMILEEENVD